jgi:hypothetical protein
MAIGCVLVVLATWSMRFGGSKEITGATVKPAKK